MSTTPCPAELVTFAERLVEASGPVIRRYFRAGVAITDKADHSPVTVADREAESTIRALIRAERPQDGIIGEEHGEQQADAEFLWVIDPIDGTKAFLTGRPIFATLIALLHRGEPVLGIIDQPITGDRWLGVAGQPTRFNGQPARVRPCPELARAILSTTSPDLFPGGDLERFRQLSARTKFTVYGGDAYGYGLLAAGFQDLVVESGLKLYDFAALAPVVIGAGGLATDWQGRPLGRHSDGRVITAGDPALHAAALAVLGGAAA